MTIEVIREDRVLVDSASRPGLRHEVDPTGPRCTCEAFMYRRGCSHLTRAAAALRNGGALDTEDPNPEPRVPGTEYYTEALYRDRPKRRSVDDVLDAMPDVVTTRWGNRGLEHTSYVPVRISVGNPKFPVSFEVGGFIKDLAPEFAWLKMSAADYDERFFGKLERVGVTKIAEQLIALSRRHNGRPLALLCFEQMWGPKASPCHRRAFAEWWESKTGRRILEIYEETGELVWVPYKLTTAHKKPEQPAGGGDQASFF